MKKVELLAPAGNMDCLIKAVQNGADAVYLGGKKFGARYYATNFDNDEMIEAIKYCHLYGVKIYVTVNTIIFDDELDDVIKYVGFLHQNQVDAIIVQDLGLISILRKVYPNLEIHASTQAHNHNDEGISYLKSLGVKRVVLARELSLKEIKSLKTDIDKEVFIHGALCVSYSGCCLFSAMHGRRSGNRGECVGSCRLPYTLLENNKEVKTNGDYLLSMKSLCTINEIDKLIESGITSFKIEGRMKSAEYVGYITKVYRDKIDNYYLSKKFNISEIEIDNIKKLYNRELTTGYLFDNHGNGVVNIKTPNHIGVVLGKVISIDKKQIKIKLDIDLNQEDGIRFDNDKGLIVNRLYNEKGLLTNKVSKGSIAIVDNKIGLKEASIVRKTLDKELIDEINRFTERKVEVEIKCNALLNDRLSITISDGENSITKYGLIIEPAQNSPTDKDRIKSQIEKLGNTPFISTNTIIESDSNIFIPIKELNELRRDCIEELIEKRKFKQVSTYVVNDIKDIKKSKETNKPQISALARNDNQIKVLIDNNIDSIYTDKLDLYKKYKDKCNIYYRTKRVSNNINDFNNENLLCTELGSINKYVKNNIVVSDYYLNITNKYSVNELNQMGVNRVTLSVENSMDNIKSLGTIFNNLEVVIYGRIELMVSKYCPINTLINKDNLKCNLCDINKYSFKDSNNNIYPIVNEKHLTHILDSNPIDLTDNINELIDSNVSSFRLELYDEDKDTIVKLINKIRDTYEYRNSK